MLEEFNGFSVNSFFAQEHSQRSQEIWEKRNMIPKESRVYFRQCGYLVQNRGQMGKMIRLLHI